MAIGFPRFAGGLEGYASYVAIRPPDWKFGVSVGEVAEALLPKSDKPLHFDGKCGNADQIVAILGNAAPASVKGAATLMVSGIPVRRRTPNPLPASRLIVGRRPGHRNRFCFCPCSASVFWLVPLQPFYLR